MAASTDRSEEEALTVFFCYRRGSDGGDREGEGGGEDVKEELHRHLCEALGGGEVFRDVESLRPGDLWPRRLEEEIRTRSVFLAVMDRHWLGRLSEPDSVVRREVDCAFRAERFVVPVLIEGTPPPSLCEEGPLRKLAAIQHHQVRRRTLRSDAEALVDRIRELARWDRRVRAAERRLQDDWEAGVWRADTENVREVDQLVKLQPIAASPRRPRLERLLSIAETLAATDRDIAGKRWNRAFRGLESLMPQERPRCAEATRRLLVLRARALRVLLDRASRYPETELRRMRRELDGLVASLDLGEDRIPGAVEVRARLEALEEIFGDACETEIEDWPLEELARTEAGSSSLAFLQSEPLEDRSPAKEVLGSWDLIRTTTVFSHAWRTIVDEELEARKRAVVSWFEPVALIDRLIALGPAVLETRLRRRTGTTISDRLLFRLHGSRTLHSRRPSSIRFLVLDGAAYRTAPRGSAVALPECSVRLRFPDLPHEPDLRRLDWRDGRAEARFRFGSFAGQVGETVTPSWTVYLDAVAVARASTELQFADRDSEPADLPLRVRRFRSALALCTVRERERFSKRLRGPGETSPGFEVAMPEVLRALDDAELVRTLERFDVLLLSWSRRARASDLVQRICRLAVVARGLEVVEAVPSGLRPPSDREVRRWLDALVRPER